MSVTASAVERFFLSYAEKINAGNVSELVAPFADSFLAAGPQGAQPVRSADFALALPKRQQVFEQLGCKSTALDSVEEIRLDTRYVLARTRWRMTFLRDGEEPKDVVASSDYIVDTGAAPWKIVFYLANQDLIQVLRDRGIGTA